ncbi:MAG TPA: tRNA epoxyqueuosine(34) reductase QueG [Verrucomicrobiota bacterium]|nr:tRNA epoxyqueuosine(34) reductase QueG [Verrucomicrobiales bacterium]HRI13752.1 tRNA epoxyqueuosine(34) reductase QueG [Verrucomicrobiota bacterium]
MASRELTEAVRRRAIELEFDACRITTADPPDSAPRFREALAEGRHAEMHWLARNAEKRVDPQRVLPGARSVVIVAASYSGVVPSDTPRNQRNRSTGVVARYACFDDYHEILKPKLRALADFLDQEGAPHTRSLGYSDTGPILERDLGQRAGLGFVGKHTGLISRELGNWFLLGEVLTTLALIPDPPERNHCGSCTRCLSACPTDALPSPFTLDARRCISYLTIEHRGSIPEDLRPLIGNRIFGCDDCLAICPWNRFARAGAALRAHSRPELTRPDLIELLELDEIRFRARFFGTPIWRTKRRGLLRNVCIALGNLGDSAAMPALRRAATDPEPLIAEHAVWALRRVGDVAKIQGQ